jgi:D-alanine-D-alanine ligase
MRVVVLHNEVDERAAADDRDVLMQVEHVSAALRRLGHEATVVSCTLDLESLQRRLRDVAPDVVFNLVEKLGGSDRLIHLAPAVLETLELSYTGVPLEAMFVTAEKLRTKARLRELGLPTPAWATAEWASSTQLRPPFIIKTIHEHASFGLDDAAVVHDAAGKSLAAWLSEAEERLGRPCFAEQFIEGREFNLSLLAAEVLPPAEIVFKDFPPGKPRIVGFSAKWAEESQEFRGTPRRFDFPPEDRGLIEQLSYLARRCWHGFGLRGYARVDFRVDERGSPWILEINANPCLSPDAGFAAALERAGISFERAVQRILADAQHPGEQVRQ